LADALREAFCGATPEAQVVQRGIMVYCRANAAGRAATMALLSTADGRPRALLRQLVQVMARGLIAQVGAPRAPDGRTQVPAYRIVGRLVAVALRDVMQVLRNAPLPRKGRAPVPSAALTGEQRPPRSGALLRLRDWLFPQDSTAL
jgi:hypothetical protein